MLSLEHNLRSAARALASAAPGAARLDLARAFCARAVGAWWAALSAWTEGAPPLRRSPAGEARGDLPKATAAAADALGRTVAALPAEEAAHELAAAYAAMLPDDWRARHGVFYTPPALGDRLLDRAGAAGVDWRTCRALDPACGGGAFLAPMARRMLAALPDGMAPAMVLQNLGGRLRGFELDPWAAWMSQVALDAVLLPLCAAARKPAPEMVAVCDALDRRDPRDLFDLVVANPPYGRVTLSAEARAAFARGLFGHANLYGVFTDLALRHARAGGVVALLTPTSVLAGEYFKNLRGLLGWEAPPVSVDLVSPRKGVFDGVLQEAMLAIYRRGGAPGPAAVHVFAPGDAGAAAAEAVGAFAPPRDLSAPWVLPRTPGDAALVARLGGLPHRLADWGYAVSTGPLVWNRHKAQLADKAGPGRFPLIWAESITPDGRFVFRADRRNHLPFFAPRLPGEECLVLRRPCVLLQRTTSKEQARRLIAAPLPSAFVERYGAVVVENHVNMVLPDAGRPVRAAPDVVAAFLNSGVADRAFRCVSGSVAVSAYELEALPLPAADTLGPLASLLAGGAGRAALDAACERLVFGGEDR